MLSRRCALKLFLDLLNEMKYFMQKKGKSFEELTDKGWMTELAFLVDVTAHLNNQKEEL